MRDVIGKNLDNLKSFQKYSPKELSKDEVDELVKIVKRYLDLDNPTVADLVCIPSV